MIPKLKRIKNDNKPEVPMALDGITVSCIKKEMSDKLCGGYITKISQPEKDELMLTIKNGGNTYRLTISASPSLPLIYFSDKNKPGPMSAPAFCMLLRKHIGSGRILKIEQPSLERVLFMIIEHRNEMGDICSKKLIIELMGKHSNIIFTDDNDMILDSIKRVPANISSVREVLPGRKYFIPQTQNKADPFTLDEKNFSDIVFSNSCGIAKALYSSVTGFSPMAADEICCRASLDPDRFAPDCTDSERAHLFHTFASFIEDIRNASYSPAVYFENGSPAEFSVFASCLYESSEKQVYGSVFDLLYSYYARREAVSRIRQKSSDLRRIVSTALERSVKKLHLQQKQLKDTEKRDSFRVYGELLTAYGYGVEEGSDKLETVNYYTGESITIPLDPEETPLENAKRYFEKYNKLKRTFEAVSIQAEETSKDIEHLESIQNALDTASDEADLAQISDELKEYGYIKKKGDPKKGRSEKAKPLHFLSSDGYDIYVGKNNYQNDELTFSSPCGYDWWFHSKGIPGSHVVVRSGEAVPPDRTFEEAGRLAAYFSKGRQASKVEIDYTLRKNVKKPAKAKPGFVVYYTNYSMMSVPDISGIEQADTQ
jgi:predicted ribosome quality control (RQC) complex YloA/Tae2 family protein